MYEMLELYLKLQSNHSTYSKTGKVSKKTVSMELMYFLIIDIRIQ